MCFMNKRIKRNIIGRFVKLMFHTKENRNMTLANYNTRCIREKEIHEIVTTDHENLKIGDAINRVGFLGFTEIYTGGVIQQEDLVYINNNYVGKVIGFDECHYPNHYNIIIKTDRPLTSEDIQINVEDTICFVDSGNKDV